MLDTFSHVHLRPGFKLASYQFIAGGNGNGFVFVIPETCELPPPHEELTFGWRPSGAPVIDTQGAALPDWVSTDIDRFLDGDGTPLSYFEASILSREARELGAIWHGCSWSTHTLLVPGSLVLKRGWNWLETEPEDWRPLVRRLPDGAASLQFYSETGLGQERIIRHTDLFTSGYQFQSQEQTIAEREGGYVF